MEALVIALIATLSVNRQREASEPSPADDADGPRPDYGGQVAKLGLECER